MDKVIQDILGTLERLEDTREVLLQRIERLEAERMLVLERLKRLEDIVLNKRW